MRKTVLLLSLSVHFACTATPPPLVSTERAAMLRATSQCIETELTRFAQSTEALELAFEQPGLTAAQTAWRESMAAWEVLELMQVGPAGPSMAPGGEGLRDALYAWPHTTRCVLEESLVARSYEALTDQLVTRRSLAALEYLLFSTASSTACSATSVIVSSGSWAALSETERATRRRAYAQSVAQALRTESTELLGKWTGGFSVTLAEPGRSNRTFMTQRAALNTVSDALFYLDATTKDAKLGAPLGLAMGSCAVPPCLETLEFQNAGYDSEALRSNLRGFRKLMQGCGENFEGDGFDSLLIAAGATGLEQRLSARLATVQASFDGAPPLRELLLSDPAKARGLYDDLKAVTDLLKTEFIGVLDLELPTSLEGDND